MEPMRVQNSVKKDCKMQVGACLHVTDLTQNLCLNSIFIVTPHKMVSWYNFFSRFGFGFTRLRKTRVILSVISSFPGQKCFEGQCNRRRRLRRVETRSALYLLRVAVSLSLRFDKHLALTKRPGRAHERKQRPYIGH